MDAKININRANSEQLAQLPNIGPALAEKIIEYRTTVHSFEEIIELAAVPGISERMVRQFEDQVTLGDIVSFETATPLLAAESEVDAPDVPKPAIIEEEPTEIVMVEETAVVTPDASIEEAEDATEVESIVAETVDEVEDVTEAVENGEETAVAETTAPLSEAEPEETEPTPPTLSFVETTPEEETSLLDPPTAIREPEQEHPMSEQPSPQPMPQAPSEPDGVSRQRGCLFIIIGAVAGAILGTTLTLALLYALNNNSLEYANQQIESDLRQAETDLENLTGTLEAVRGDVGTISTQADGFADEQTTLSTALGAVETDVEDVQADVSSVEDDVSDLLETAVSLEERLDTVAVSAETFDAFLEGMQALLMELSGEEVMDEEMDSGETAVPITTTVTATGTPTPFTPLETPTPTQPPTRTPRPTATPIVLPTAEQQP